MNRADTAAVSAWTLLGLSVTQISEALQIIALVLTIVATAISIFVHIRNKFWVTKT